MSETNLNKLLTVRAVVLLGTVVCIGVSVAIGVLI